MLQGRVHSSIITHIVNLKHWELLEYFSKLATITIKFYRAV